MTPISSPSFQNTFVQFAGELAENLNFNRSIGQIYGLLYVSARPLSLEQIAQQAMMSKGNASINLRTLESWGAVRSVWVNGSRRDHYEANKDLKALTLQRLQEGLGKRLDLAEQKLQHLLKDMDQNSQDVDIQALKKHITALNQFLQSGRRALKLLPKVFRLVPQKWLG